MADVPQKDNPFHDRADRQRAVSVAPLRGVAGGKNPFTTWRVEPDEGQREAMDSVRVWASHLAEALLGCVPAGPERTLAMRKLMECVREADYAITHVDE